MKRRLSIVCLALLTTGLWAQQTESEKPETKTYSGRVVDAETGEELPFSTIYFSKTKGTKTNSRGEFSIESSPDSTLVFSCVGYERLPVKASELQKEVRLTPMTAIMREVTVTPPSAQIIMHDMEEQLKWEYKRWKYEIANFDVTATIRNNEGEKKYKTRADIQSAGNLRYFLFQGRQGVHFYSHIPGDIDLIFNYQTHICDLMGVSAHIEGLKFWKSTITPVDNPECYNSSVQTLRGKEGQQLYVIHSVPKNLKKLRKKTIVGGTLYMDAMTKRLLRFKGEALNLKLNSLPTKLNFQIDYRHYNGFTEVEQMLLEGENTENAFRMVFFNRMLNTKNMIRTAGSQIKINLDKSKETDSTKTNNVVIPWQPLPEEEVERIKADENKWIEYAGEKNMKKRAKNYKKYWKLYRKAKM